MFHTGTIARRWKVSPSVMMLDIDVPSLGSFLPGQWVDFVAKPNEWVGGFSIASSPRDLPRISLAVKNSRDPPATWVHGNDKGGSAVGVKVEVRVGGDCVLEEELPPKPSVFCAGGIGVSPILSQYREFVFLREKTASIGSSPTDATAAFLYTSSTVEELVFGEELAELSREGCERGHDKMVFALTKQEEKTSNTDRLADGIGFPPHVEFRRGRVMTEFLDEAPSDANFYVCGPPSMIDDAVRHLTRVRGISPENIKYEKWW